MGVRKYRDTPDPTDAFMTRFLDDRVSEPRALDALIRLRSNAFLLNRKANRWKALAWKVSAVTLTASALITAVLILQNGTEAMSDLENEPASDGTSQTGDNDSSSVQIPAENDPGPSLEDLMEVGMGTEEKSLDPDEVQFFEK